MSHMATRTVKKRASKETPPRDRRSGEASARGETLLQALLERLNAELDTRHGAKKAFAEKVGFRRQQLFGYLSGKISPDAKNLCVILNGMGWSGKYGAKETWELTVQDAVAYIHQQPEGTKSALARESGLDYLRLHRYLMLQRVPPAWIALAFLDALAARRSGK